jgi:hypothetical protein
MDKKTTMENLARESYEKGGFAKLEFGKDCLTIDGITCKKL